MPALVLKHGFYLCQRQYKQQESMEVDLMKICILYLRQFLDICKSENEIALI